MTDNEKPPGWDEAVAVACEVQPTVRVRMGDGESSLAFKTGPEYVAEVLAAAWPVLAAALADQIRATLHEVSDTLDSEEGPVILAWATDVLADRIITSLDLPVAASVPTQGETE